MKTRSLPSACFTALAVLAALSFVPLPARADAPPTMPPSVPPPPPSPAVAPAPASSTGSSASRKAVALGAAGVAAAGAIGAVVFGVLALHEKSAYESTPTYANTDDGNNFAAYADGCIALAAAAGITSLVLFVTSPDSVGAGSAAQPRLSAAFWPAFWPAFSLSPVVTAHGGGAGAVLRF